MDLLDYISDRLGCQYISQLHYISITPDQAGIILDLPTDTFTLHDYQEAVRYIDMDDTPCYSIEYAKQLMIQKLLAHTIAAK